MSLETICVEEYFSNGNIAKRTFYLASDPTVIHNDNGPAEMVYYPNGEPKCFRYFKNGLVHRDGKYPAHIVWHENGVRIYEAQYKDGKVHTDDDGFAVATHWPNGVTKSMVWFKHGVIHNDKGPALYLIHKNGNYHVVKSYIDGKLHNEKDYAVRTYREDGSEARKEYWLNDAKIPKDHWVY